MTRPPPSPCAAGRSDRAIPFLIGSCRRAYPVENKAQPHVTRQVFAVITGGADYPDADLDPVFSHCADLRQRKAEPGDCARAVSDPDAVLGKCVHFLIGQLTAVRKPCAAAKPACPFQKTDGFASR